MTKQKQMTEKELDQVSGGPHYKDFNGRPGVIGLDVGPVTNWGVTVGRVAVDIGPITPHPAPPFRDARIGVPPEPK